MFNLSIFYMFGFALTMVLVSLAEGLFRHIGARR